MPDPVVAGHDEGMPRSDHALLVDFADLGIQVGGHDGEAAGADPERADFGVEILA